VHVVALQFGQQCFFLFLELSAFDGYSLFLMRHLFSSHLQLNILLEDIFFQPPQLQIHPTYFQVFLIFKSSSLAIQISLELVFQTLQFDRIGMLDVLYLFL
jgi:hypothetical protein